MTRRSVSVLAALAMCGAAATTAARAQTESAPKEQTPSISVEGEAARDVAPDLAIISVGVTTTRGTAQDASQQNSRVARALIDAAKQAGLSDADIKTTEATLSPVYDSPKDGSAPRPRAFQATNVLAIRTQKLDSVGELTGRLLDQGANDLQGVEFTIANPEPVLDDLRAEAARNAKHRAEIYAEAIGARIGRVLAIRPGATEAPPTMRAMKVAAPASMPLPLSVGTRRLEAQVTITWALDEPAH